VQDGEVVPTCTTGSFCRRHPRSGIGVTADGKVLLVVVDGRRAGWSVGMNLTEFAQLFQFLGATSAMNLDGGGSSVMVVQGKVVNKPSDGRERRVSSAVLVLSGKDKDETAFNGSTTSPRTAAPAGGSGVRAFRAALLDPGSTGGMLDALARGAFGGKPARLDPGLRTLVREFRSGR
jgi:hypothetical protein